jgi:hypothetical protein
MSAQVAITQLPAAGAITGTEAVPIVQNGVTVQTTTAALAGSPVQTYTYLTVSHTPQLANSRYVGATNGLVITDGGAQGLFNIGTTGALLSLVNSSAGFQVKTDATTLTNRSIAISGNGLSISNGSGVSGNPTISLSGQALNFANASFDGLVTLSTAGAITGSTITGTSNQITVTNGSGVGGNPTISITSNPSLPGTAGVVLPSGTTGQRSVAPTNGTLRYNTSTTLLEAYLNNTWTSLASGSGVTSIATGTGLTGGPITSTGTISIDVTGVTAGAYTNANITVNAQGQITSASNGAAGGVTSFSAGTTGFTPSTGTTGAITLAGTLALTNGGSGQTTAQLAMNAFAGAVTSGSYLRGNGTNVVMNTIQVADVPTLNQNTTGTAANVTGTVAILNGGTGQTTASAAFNALSPITTTGDLIIGTGVNTASRLAIGSNGYLLTSNGTTASWAAAPAGGVTTFSAGTTGLTPSGATSGAVTLAGTLAVLNGGTGATNATDARTNLVAAKSGTNSDITELYALNGTSYGVAYQNAGNQLIMGSALTFNGSMLFVPGGISGGTF